MSRRRRRQFSLRLLLFVVLPVAAALTLIGKGVAEYTGLVQPPRPMYCNVYGYHERGQTFPTWGPSYCMYDDANHIGWADFEDNAILIVDPSDAAPVACWSIHPRMKATQVEFGIPGRMATVNRSTNVLVVVRRDGRVQQFPIGQGVAKPFYDENVFHNNTRCPNLVDAAPTILAEREQRNFDAFLGLDTMSK